MVGAAGRVNLGLGSEMCGWEANETPQKGVVLRGKGEGAARGRGSGAVRGAERANWGSEMCGWEAQETPQKARFEERQGSRKDRPGKVGSAKTSARGTPTDHSKSHAKTSMYRSRSGWGQGSSKEGSLGEVEVRLRYQTGKVSKGMGLLTGVSQGRGS